MQISKCECCTLSKRFNTRQSRCTLACHGVSFPIQCGAGARQVDLSTKSAACKTLPPPLQNSLHDHFYRQTQLSGTMPINGVIAFDQLKVQGEILSIRSSLSNSWSAGNSRATLLALCTGFLDSLPLVLSVAIYCHNPIYNSEIDISILPHKSTSLA